MQGPGGRGSSPTQANLPNVENDLANAPYEKQHSALLRKGSSIKKMYTRWESRGKWWAERDEAGAFDDGVQEKSQSSLGQRLQLARDRLVHWFRTLGTVSRKHPSTLLLPLLLLAACLAGGIAGVELAANKAAQQAQDVARAAAEQTAVSLEMLLGGQRVDCEMWAAVCGVGVVTCKVVLWQPVFVSGVERSEDWGQLRGVQAGAPATATAGGATSPASSDATAAPSLADLHSVECGGACYLDRLSMRVSPAVLLEATSTNTNGTGSTGGGSGTSVMLFRIATGGADAGASSAQADLVTAAQSAAAPSGQRVVSVPVHLSPSAATGYAPALMQTAAQEQQAQQAQAATTYGELQVASDTGSWRPDWEGPLIAVVVCVSAALAWLLLVALLAYRRHTALLQAMLPEDVLALLASGQRYYQHLDNVTVLYADVVRYMAVGSDNHQHKSPDLKSAQNGGADRTSRATGLPTRDVVKLLNAVHSMYDGIMAKYGLVKIQRSGPAVAAVVGTRLPRFSLFGDVVDVAYYMEATGSAMAVHVSQTTMQLLTLAGNPLLQLQPRGPLDMGAAPGEQGGGASGYDDDIGGCSGLMGGLETVAEAGRDYQQGEGLPAGRFLPQLSGTPTYHTRVALLAARS
eukprot:XP_001692294.1 predicted protein [Chlamydomonas reinhardtii]